MWERKSRVCRKTGLFLQTCSFPAASCCCVLHTFTYVYVYKYYVCIHRIPKSGNMNHCPQSLEPMPAGIEKRNGSSASHGQTGLQVPLPTSRSSTSGMSRSSRTSQKSSQASSQASRKVRVSGYILLLADFVEKERRLSSLSRVNRASLEQINEKAEAEKYTLWQNTCIIVTITLIPICFLVGCLVLVIVLDDTLPTS